MEYYQDSQVYGHCTFLVSVSVYFSQAFYKTRKISHLRYESLWTLGKQNL